MPRVYTRIPLADRFWSKVTVAGDDECWEWTGATHKGYGKIMLIHGVFAAAHRLAYEFLVGPIPPKMQLDHLCRNRGCVNPAHLDPVTNQENARRGLRGSLVTHCVHGHAYTQANTFVRKNGRRACRTCNRLRNKNKADAAYWRDYRAKRTAAGRPVGRK